MADDLSAQNELEPREPTVEDLRDLCRELNHRGARYVVVGGFAIRAAGYNRRTMDLDLVVARDPENERCADSFRLATFALADEGRYPSRERCRRFALSPALVRGTG
jgi:hypothetical protein